MRKAFIPELGTKLKLEKDWTFDVHLEHRNKQLYESDGRSVKRWGQSGKSYKRTLPAGSTFMVDRIYVRNGAHEYSSVTLLLLDTTDPTLSKLGKKTQPFKAKGARHFARFWVKLVQFNEADFTVTHDASRPMEVKEVCGDPITLKRFKARDNAIWWVKFEHEDPELCFEGKLEERLLGSIYHRSERDYWRLERGWTEKSEQGKDWYGQSKTFYNYSPPHYLKTFIPDSWKKEHASNPRFVRKGLDYFGREVEEAFHPLEDKIHIPFFKKDRKHLNLPNDKALLEKVPLADGFLTVCDIKEVEA